MGAVIAATEVLTGTEGTTTDVETAKEIVATTVLLAGQFVTCGYTLVVVISRDLGDFKLTSAAQLVIVTSWVL